MSFSELGLSKLKITAFRDKDYRTGSKIGVMKAMYNPESLDLHYDVEYNSSAIRTSMPSASSRRPSPL